MRKFAKALGALLFQTIHLDRMGNIRVKLGVRSFAGSAFHQLVEVLLGIRNAFRLGLGLCARECYVQCGR